MHVTQPKWEEMACPSHFTEIHINKLEDAFSKRQKPDDIRLHVLAMECNLLYNDVNNWFKARRLKWIQDLVRDDVNNNADKKEKSPLPQSKKTHIINHSKKSSFGSKNKKISHSLTND